MASKTLFSGMSDDNRKRALTFFQVKEYGPNDRIVTMDETGNELFFIQSGHVTVKVEKGVVAEMGPGNSFGEICLVDGGRRSASVFAVDRVRSYVLDTPALNTMMAQHPKAAVQLVVNLLFILGEKLRSADETINDHLTKERKRDKAASSSVFKKIMGRVS